MALITDLYNKVLNFFNNENKEQDNSKNTACNRLKLVLMQDRAKLEPEIMEKLRAEMIDVISKYIEIDTEALGLNLEAEGESFALMLNIPVIRAKTREEIEEAEKLASDVDDDDDDSDDIEENEFGDDESSDDSEVSDDGEDEEDDDEDTHELDEPESDDEAIEDDLSDDVKSDEDENNEISKDDLKTTSIQKESNSKRKKKEKIDDD